MLAAALYDPLITTTLVGPGEVVFAAALLYGLIALAAFATETITDEEAVVGGLSFREQLDVTVGGLVVVETGVVVGDQHRGPVSHDLPRRGPRAP